MKLTISGVDIEIENFSGEDYKSVTGVLERCLSDQSFKNRDAIRYAFEQALMLGPDANPSDLWHHVVYRQYEVMLPKFRKVRDAGQSWKRASGEAFEVFLGDYYNTLLKDTDIRLVPLVGKTMQVASLKLLGVYGKVGDSKLDVAIMHKVDKDKLATLTNGKILGGIHAKASLAERVSDDVPASKEMMKKGFVSYLVTLDVKSFPTSETMSDERAFINNGELGTPKNPSDKRKYIEEHGSFDACFSFNLRTVASPAKTNSRKRIYVSGLSGKWDQLCDVLTAAGEK